MLRPLRRVSEAVGALDVSEGRRKAREALGCGLSSMREETGALMGALMVVRTAVNAGGGEEDRAVGSAQGCCGSDVILKGDVVGATSSKGRRPSRRI